MKNLPFLLVMLLMTSFGYSQSPTSESLPKANVTKLVIQNDTTQFTFISNYYIDAYKAPMLEGRMINRYSEIIDIQINAETQTIVFKTLTVGSNIFLEKFVKHFKYSGYEIH